MYRMRRLRRTEGIRDLVRENRLSVKELVYPLFVVEGVNLKIRVPSMPGVFQYSLDRLPELLDQLLEAGVNAVLVFGVPLRKDEAGSEAYNRDGIAQRAVRKIRAYAPEMVIISDVCLCEYTSHGHCGLIRGGEILNDESLPLLARALHIDPAIMSGPFITTVVDIVGLIVYFETAGAVLGLSSANL